MRPNSFFVLWTYQISLSTLTLIQLIWMSPRDERAKCELEKRDSPYHRMKSEFWIEKKGKKKSRNFSTHKSYGPRQSYSFICFMQSVASNNFFCISLFFQLLALPWKRNAFAEIQIKNREREMKKKCSCIIPATTTMSRIASTRRTIRTKLTFCHDFHENLSQIVNVYPIHIPNNPQSSVNKFLFTWQSAVLRVRSHLNGECEADFYVNIESRPSPNAEVYPRVNKIVAARQLRWQTNGAF